MHLHHVPKAGSKPYRKVVITQGADPTVVAIRGEAQLTSVNGGSWMFHLFILCSKRMFDRWHCDLCFFLKKEMQLIHEVMTCGNFGMFHRFGKCRCTTHQFRSLSCMGFPSS